MGKDAKKSLKAASSKVAKKAAKTAAKKVDKKPEFKLYYFHLFVRADMTRMMLSHANADWEDVYFGRGFLHWKEHKPNMPYPHQLPILELADGTKLTQSIAIARFVAKRFGYYPDDPLLAARCDEFVYSTYSDDKVFLKALKPSYLVPETIEEDTRACFEEALPELMRRVGPLLKDDGFLFGKKPLMPDFFLGSFYFSVMDNPNASFGIKDG